MLQSAAAAVPVCALNFVILLTVYVVVCVLVFVLMCVLMCVVVFMCVVVCGGVCVLVCGGATATQPLDGTRDNDAKDQAPLHLRGLHCLQPPQAPVSLSHPPTSRVLRPPSLPCRALFLQRTDLRYAQASKDDLRI